MHGPPAYDCGVSHYRCDLRNARQDHRSIRWTSGQEGGYSASPNCLSMVLQDTAACGEVSAGTSPAVSQSRIPVYLPVSPRRSLCRCRLWHVALVCPRPPRALSAVLQIGGRPCRSAPTSDVDDHPDSMTIFSLDAIGNSRNRPE